MRQFAREEERIIRFWNKNDIFKKVTQQNKGKKNFVFYEGPPSANGAPGLHHVLSRSFKDVIIRYKTMRGYYVPRKAGWDTHGLPIEIALEKRLGFTHKNQIEAYGIAKFNRHAQDLVWEYKTQWDKLTKRMGFWLDLDHPYITYTADYIESLWSIIKRMHQNGLLYEDFKVIPYCPRCETPLSSHEVAQGYKTVSDESAYVKFAVNGQDHTYLLAWTTTPWTLPANAALAIGKDITYVQVQL
ncbi:class I tRNA ligase family protein, partial [Patescibacteria group bacterium]|nr:class I tRNA ligase family protein [Patescibacteria group bacterium]